MLMNYLKSFAIVAVIATFTLSCGQKQSEDDTGNDETGESEISTNGESTAGNNSAVCLWSAITLRETPEAKGKFKSTIYLGEKAVFLNETAIDSTDKKKPVEYVKIKLSDGTIGWAQANMMAVGTSAYALRDKTKLYKRPDILSAGQDEFDKMQYVVILEEQGEWVKIKGKKRSDKWFKEGWVKVDKINDNEIDVTVAILAERAMIKDNPDKKLEALKEIVDNPDFSNSVFIEDVRLLIESLAMPEPPAEDIGD
jgi:hypothetical protein